jgi:acetyl-CoA carboxylase carboxyl transferase subunit beta
MSKREEDIEKNLTGEDLPQQDHAKSSWFKRVHKGIC